LTRDYTSGNIWKALIFLAVPMILEMMMEALFALVDIYYLSKVSEDAVAAVGITESVVTLIYALGIGIASGATAMVARRIGEKNPEEASVAASQAIIVTVIFSFIIAVPGFIFGEQILILMGGEPEMVAEGLWYTKIMMATNVVIMLLFVLNGIFRGAGDAKIAMYSLALSSVINIVLDPIFIFGFGPIPEMGVKGAAVATSIGRGIGVAFQLYILFNSKSQIKITRATFKWIPEVMGRLIKIASGGTMQYVIGSASWIVMVRIIADFGTEAVAAYTYAVRIIIFTILPAWGLANAASTLVGQNLGAEKPDRAEKSVWMTCALNVGFLLIVSVVFFIFAEEFIGFFDSTPTIVAEGTKGLKIFSIGYVAYAFGMVISSAFNGAGDTFTPTLMNFICFWIIQIPLAYYLVYNFEFQTTGVYIAIVLAEVIMGTLAIILFKRGTWKKTKV